MSAGVAWALLAALGFGFTQILNRKSNLIIGAYRTAYALLMTVEILLIGRGLATGEFRLLAEAPLSALAFFAGSATIHYVAGWTLLAKSQEQIGVARTGAVTSVAPLVGTLMAAMFLDEALTPLVVLGVLLSIAGVTMVSMSRAPQALGRWQMPTFALAVALCWGSSPVLIRKGLLGLDAPVLGLTVGLGAALVAHTLVLSSLGGFRRGTWDSTGIRWAAAGGVTGAVGIGSQWISFGLIPVAVAFTVQQLATLVVVALAPLVFGRATERLNAMLLGGTAAMLAGSLIVVWAGNR